MNYLLAVVAVIGWAFVLDYRKQNKFLKQKNEGFKSALLAYMMYRYKDLAKIEKLERQAKVCDFSKEAMHSGDTIKNIEDVVTKHSRSLGITDSASVSTSNEVAKEIR